MRRLLAVVLSLISAACGARLAPGEVKVKGPELVLRASPRFMLSGQTLTLWAEIKGDVLADEWVCPEVEWEMPNGDHPFTVESDCSNLVAPDTLWSYTVGPLYNGGETGVDLTFAVNLRHAGHLFARRSVTVILH